MSKIIDAIFQRDCWNISKELLLNLNFITYDGKNFSYTKGNKYYEIRTFNQFSISKKPLSNLKIKEKLIKTEIKGALLVSCFSCRGEDYNKITEKHGIKKRCDIQGGYGKFMYHTVNGLPSYLIYDLDFNIYTVNWSINGIDFTDRIKDLYLSFEHFDLNVCISEDFRRLIKINLDI